MSLNNEPALESLGRGCYAFIQPDGGWGLSNAGLISDGEQSLLIDTLQKASVTRTMLQQMRSATPAAKEIDYVINTHAHGDHTFGNQVVAHSQIITTSATLEDMRRNDAAMFSKWRELGDAGLYLRQMSERLELADYQQVLPNRTFDERLDLKVGDKTVQLLEITKAHTRSDILVWSPSDRIVFTGDLLFHQVHPVLGGGPVQNWLDALDQILRWDVEAVVPGHGPVTDKAGVRGLRDYIVYVRDEATKRFRAGMSVEQAAKDISLDAFRGWPDEERIFRNVGAIYEDLGGPKPDFVESMATAARWKWAKDGGRPVFDE